MTLATFGKTLPEELRQAQLHLEEVARGYGLDFFPTIFEMVDYDQMNAIAAYGGFPKRYPHWRFGMEYERLSKSYRYGLHKIYEMVINNDPCYAYLLQSNTMTDHKLVMAHVFGHCDFFKNNQWFAHTNRKMMDEMANHGNRIRRYMDRFGVETVETFIDACLSIENLIDIYSPHIKRSGEEPHRSASATDEEEPPPEPGRFQAKEYMDRYINPPEALEAERRRLQQKQKHNEERFPAQPQRDVMLFLLEHAPLKAWQLDVLAMIREEAYYYAPQGQTKIMNEGWATYWHTTIMTRHGLEPDEVICYADHTAGTLASYGGRLNPYKLGLELFRHIEDRWNRGCFGPEYEACDDWETRRNWNTEAGLGREKIFQVRRIHNDVTFIDEFLTPEFVYQQRLFAYRYNDQADYYEIESREFKKVKQRLLFQLTNLGRPHIQVLDANFKNRGELFLEHVYNGVPLDLREAKDTLENLHTLWRRPVHIQTVLDDRLCVLSYDGHEHQMSKGKNKIRPVEEDD